MTDAPETSRTPSRLAAGVRGAIAAGLCGASLIALAGPAVWLLDLIANLAAQLAVVSLVIGAWWLIRKKPIAAGACVLAGVVALLAVALAAPRRLTLDQSTAPDLRVRVLIVNALAQNEDRTVADMILAQDADIVCLHESPWWLIEELKEGGRWRETYPYYWLSDRAGPGFLVLLSMWPQRSVTDLRDGAQFAALGPGRTAVIDRPAGAFVMSMLHPRSPRSPTRWREGNEMIDRLIERDRDNIRPRGLPLVVAGDLNTTPTGVRSRWLSERHGLARAKPVLAAAGTIGPVWPLSIAIDDALVPRGTPVTAWRTIDLPGSDHRGVLVEFELPDRR
ncbi:MAG: endonuclease/exonuclease/phosphatase family protein [Planctomycetota bacterium]